MTDYVTRLRPEKSLHELRSASREALISHTHIVMQVKTAAGVVLVTILTFVAYRSIRIGTSPEVTSTHASSQSATIGSSGSKAGSSNMVAVKVLARLPHPLMRMAQNHRGAFRVATMARSTVTSITSDMHRHCMEHHA